MYGINLVLDSREDEKKIVEKIQGQSRHSTISLVLVESSDSNKAEQMAIQATDQALNVLRFYVRECRILIKGEELKEIDRIIVTCNLTDKIDASQITEHCNMIDPDCPDEIIDNDFIDKLNEKDFDIISNLLTKSEENLTQLQKDILTAIYSIRNAEIDTISHDKLIKDVIALDALLAKGRSDKSETVAKRYTAIMCQYWEDNDLIQRYCMIKTYYSIRNQIVHGGLRYIDENILKQLRLWVSELVYNLLSYCSVHNVITDLFKNLFPVKENLLKNVKCEDNPLIV